MVSHGNHITTSRRQGQVREGLSGGSPSAKLRADEQEPHTRPSPWMSQHKMTKSIRCGGQGKCGGCAVKVHVLIRGDLPGMRSGPFWAPAARRTATCIVIRQKSAEAIVAGRARMPVPRRAEHV